MGYFRLFRRIKIAPGVTINVSKSGLSTSLGPKGAKVTVGKRGIRKTVGIPGTGMYYTSLSSPKAAAAAPVTPAVGPTPQASSGWKPRTWIGILIAVVILAAAIGSAMGGNTAGRSPSAPPAALGLGLVGLGASSFEATTAPTETVASPATAGAPTTTTKPTRTPQPTAKPKPTSAPASTTIPVKVSSRTATVPRNSTATVSIKTSPKARCSIDVEYKSGPSTAAGLGDKTASSTGMVSWSWKVGSNTTRGTWPIHVSCDLGSRSGSVDTSFTVRYRTVVH